MRRSSATSVFSFLTYRMPSDSSGEGAHHRGQHLCPRQRLERVGRGLGQHQLAALAHDQQPRAGQHDAARAELLLRPADLAGAQLHGAQRRAELLAAVVAVQDAVRVDRRGVVVGQAVEAGPDIHEVRSLHAQHAGARPILGRHEDQIADHHGRRRIHRVGVASPPRPAERDGSGGGIQPEQRGPREEHRKAAAADGRTDGRRVAGLVVGCRPQHLARGGVERHDAGALPADVGDQPAVLDQRRSRGAEEALGDAVACGRVLAPAFLPVGQAHGVQLALRAEGVDDAVGHHRHGARALVEPEVVAVVGGVGVAPLRWRRS